MLTGVETDGGFTFTGVLEATSDLGEGAELVLSQTTTVVVSDEGGQLSGSRSDDSETRCTGNAVSCEFFEPSNCTTVRNFVAVRADEPVEAAQVDSGGDS